MKNQLKIVVVGCGAVGSYYGAKLARAGHEVHFLLRSDYEAVRANGVRIESPEGDFSVRPVSWRESEPIGACDVVLIGLKTTANHQLRRLVSPLVNAETLVLTLQNGLGNEEALASFVDPARVMGGLCFVCLNRIKPGLIRHMAHGLVVVGDFQKAAGPRAEELAHLFRHAGFPCQATDNLARARWEKLTWNIPFNGLGVASAAGLNAMTGPESDIRQVQSCLTTDRLISDPAWLTILEELMREVIGGARALGYTIPDSVVDVQIGRTRSMGPYKASTLLDFENGYPLELQSMFLEPLARAKAAGASMPLLERLCRVLTELEKA